MPTKEVYFEVYCPKCKHYDKRENEDPCWGCLENGYNFDSHRPINYDAKEEK